MLGQFTGLIGVLVILVVCYFLSTNKSKVSLRVVGFGLLLQVLFAFIILRTDTGKAVFNHLNAAVMWLLGFTNKGSEFCFGWLVNEEGSKTVGFLFAFNVVPTIIFFSAFMAILYHLGIMQKIIYVIAFVMQKTMGTSGAESLSAAANIFVGQTEAPLVIKPYLNKMTRSELMCIMTGGMATVAGGVMAGYVGMLKDAIPGIAGYLMAASCMAAPAALVLSKILVPEEEVPETSGKLEFSSEKVDENVIAACSRGCSEGMQLGINVVAMLIGFTAMIHLIDGCWSQIANLVHLYSVNTLDKLIGVIMYPVAFMIGVPETDISAAGALIGKKLILNEFVAYSELKILLTDPGAPIHLAEKTKMLLSYALCGFANLSSIGIQIGGIGTMAPERRPQLAQLALRALLAGALASFLTASIAGMFFDESSVMAVSTAAAAATGTPAP